MISLLATHNYVYPSNRNHIELRLIIVMIILFKSCVLLHVARKVSLKRWQKGWLNPVLGPTLPGDRLITTIYNTGLRALLQLLPVPHPIKTIRAPPRRAGPPVKQRSTQCKREGGYQFITNLKHYSILATKPLPALRQRACRKSISNYHNPSSADPPRRTSLLLTCTPPRIRRWLVVVTDAGKRMFVFVCLGPTRWPPAQTQ